MKRRSLAFAAGLLCAAASLAGSPGNIPQRDRPLTVLQLNLCNSGAAGCFTGRAVAQASAVIRIERPDVVALNEICEADVDELAGALTAVRSRGAVVTGFQPAFSARTGQKVRCNNGQAFGIGLLAHVPQIFPLYAKDGGLYPMQTRGEQRAWLCLYIVATVHACTTHLALGVNGTSLAQCRYLVETAIPAMRREGDRLPTVVAGDLNLGAADSLPCLPPHYTRIDDGAVQQVMAGQGLTIGSSRLIDMRGATDHPGLLVSINKPALTVSGPVRSG